ncbi:porin [Sulfuricurvum sp.]|uniref:porin n=1 Tax=Sulfuricurvum sp. TaxID=2025608 RepID=UPI00261296F7|nr:porin [Sulfuricurvum sp.]
MSLAAAVLLGTSAFALDNVKVSGDAKLFYTTSDRGANLDLFDKDASAADTALRIGATGDLLKGVSFGVTGYAVSTLGLENNLVSNTWTGAHGVATGNGASFDPLGTNGLQVDDASWMGEAWVAATVAKTTVKLGRMEIDSPLAFSEKWSIVPNTFDAALVINQDLPDTTLVGAWVGKGNGVNPLGRDLDPNTAGVQNKGTINHTPIGDNVVGTAGKFNTFMNGGAYAFAAVNNSFKPLTAQAWYYNVVNVANAYWLQGDINCRLVPGLTIGLQYADMAPKGVLEGVKDSKAYALKVGYGIDALKVSAAYSSTDKDGTLKVANVATDNLAAAQSKLYTEAWWDYGYVGAPDATSMNLTAEYDAKNLAKFGAYYTNVSNGAAANAGDMNELAVTATKSFGPLDVTAAYINEKHDGLKRANTVQAYLTLNF